ncbi:imidazole glycerol phosphate synthase subunit HisF [Shinella zoogloeoides]|uniref:imidazole glycerol phosphate synthase subunit HisF n=1 Tax=Shinella zoogloeoides TaxID=352475 RepID=UPI00273D442A|nr:imidazole glycerol phosphate synthase cyclase subunit [Shinella zoogloeoides]WLR92419.1 imidazole glycerol phosphate synthase cyclase subunit [Shinella zoogloeoides]
MKNVRIIPRLDIKGPNLIKGIHLEGLRVVGDPHAFALRYYEEGADELVFMDIVASLYGRNNLSGIIERAADRVFIPITVGGGIRSVDDARHILRSGADKVAINTAAVQRPEVIGEISREFGSQATVLSIEAKEVGPGRWEAYTDNGRERTGLDVIDWTKRAVELGAGEVLLTSVDKEGTRKGYDLDLIAQVTEAVPVPVIASGGLGTLAHLGAALALPRCAAVSMADVLHYKRLSLSDIKNTVRAAGMATRVA